MATKVNPEMLTLAREARGLTQEKLGDKAGLSQGFISRAEHGFISVSEPRLNAIARVLEYPPAFFCLDETAVGLRCHRRKKQSMRAAALKQIEARLNIIRIQVSRLIKDDIDLPEPNYPRLDIDAFDSVEEVAAIVRRTWQLPIGPVRNLVGAVEAAGGIVVRADFGTDRLDALSQRAPDGRPFFYLNTHASADRWRFNLAHELGHIFMHTVGSLGDQEEQAHRFAGAFLMPPTEIAPQLKGLTMPKLADLKAHWLVSMQAIIQHAFYMGKISDRQRRSFFTRMSQLGYRKSEPIDIPQEEPTLVKQVIDLHRSEHGYSLADLSQIALVGEAEFQSTYLGEPPRRLSLVR